MLDFRATSERSQRQRSFLASAPGVTVPEWHVGLAQAEWVFAPRAQHRTMLSLMAGSPELGQPRPFVLAGVRLILSAVCTRAKAASRAICAGHWIGSPRCRLFPALYSFAPPSRPDFSANGRFGCFRWRCTAWKSSRSALRRTGGHLLGEPGQFRGGARHRPRQPGLRVAMVMFEENAAAHAVLAAINPAACRK